MSDAESELTPDAENVRVITVLGHVDHGKTTFVDSLLAANNIISTRLAGKIRYLDSREDEQERGITMESSAISLRFKLMPKLDNDATSSLGKQYLINLIDTPGHVDFSSEVSTASRLCDGAFVLVDVVEGVCTQTVTVLRQVWTDGIKPILVINKMDRLVTELKQQPIEAYHHLTRLLEKVNAVIGGFYASERMEQDYKWRENRERKLEARREAAAEAASSSIDASSLEDNELFEDEDDEDLYFSPDKGNVIFASAMDGWGFRVGNFARIFATRLGTKEVLLRKVLWGDYYIEPKTKRIIGQKHLRGRNLKPLFVQLVLENLWAIYDNVLGKLDHEKVLKIVASLELSLPQRELKSKDARTVLTAIFSRWLPLAATSVQAVVEVVPSPVTAQSVRIPRMLRQSVDELGLSRLSDNLKHDLSTCSREAASCVIVYVSKMFAVPNARLATRKFGFVNESRTENEPERMHSVGETSGETLLGFARIYCGVLRVGMKVYAILPKYNNSLPSSHPHNEENMATVTIDALYVMMGRELLAAPEIRAGNVFAIGGLEHVVWRNATLCRNPGPDDQPSLDHSSDRTFVVNLGGAAIGTPPILRVALETRVPADMPKLIRGLKLLSQADPCVETFQQNTGEHVILTAGEIHLERCLKDLQERFARTDIQVSEPIVPFRETVSRTDGPVISANSIHHIENEYLHIKLRALPLPEDLVEFINSHSRLLAKIAYDGHVPTLTSHLDAGNELPLHDLDKAAFTEETFWQQFYNLLASSGLTWQGTRVWAFGPGGAGPNVLIDNRKTKLIYIDDSQENPDMPNSLDGRIDLQDLDRSLLSGFQYITSQGPLCAEPLEGLAFIVDELSIILSPENKQLPLTNFHITCLSAMKEACKLALLKLPLRLMLAVYKCEVQAAGEVLGKVYDVISRRQGQVLSEEVQEGTNFFSITALLPVVQSFGLALEIRKKTSGAAYPQLFFAGYKLLDVDPFWIPTTAEELEDLGEKADRANVAKAYMDTVRARKGLLVDKKIVGFAEKQRTLKR